jgi:hypothetical protein
MVDNTRTGSKAPTPLSNAEVKQMLKGKIMGSNSNITHHINEQGHVLRSQTEDYLIMFNEFEEPAEIQ